VKGEGIVQTFVVVATAPDDVLRYAAAFFLIVVAVGMVYALIRLARTLRQVDKLVEDTDREMVPLLSRAQVTLDEVNSELAKVDLILGSAVNVTSKVDATTNVVQTAVSAPAKKAAAFSAGVTQAVSSFFSRHSDEGAAATTGDEAGAQRPSWSSTWSQGAPTTESWADAQAAASSAAKDIGGAAAAAAGETSAAAGDAESAVGAGANASPVSPSAGEGGAAAEATIEETSAP
jgi:uncharacterized protein YoxC